MTKTTNHTPHTADARIRFAFTRLRDASRADPIGSAIERVALRLLASRRRRACHFEGDLFRDPAWDIMLDLFAAQCQGRSASLSGACAVAGVPHATALRIVQYLAKTGLVEQYGDPSDPYGTYVKLSADGDRSMRGFLAEEAASAW